MTKPRVRKLLLAAAALAVVAGGTAFAVFARMAIGLALAALLLAVWRIGFPLHARARRSYLAGGLGLFGAMTLV